MNTYAYNSEVTAIHESVDGWIIQTPSASIKTKCLINSAGLYAHKIADMAGFTQYKQAYLKGEYYKSAKKINLNHLVYSVPPSDGLSLGIHSRHYLDGTIGFGPNAYPTNSIDYNINASNSEEFIRDIQKYLNIQKEGLDLYPDYSGIRPKSGTGDFIIDVSSTESKRFVNLIGIESPGLTSTLEISDYVCGIIE